MLLGLSGPSYSGKSMIASILYQEHRFFILLIDTDYLRRKYTNTALFFDTPERLLEYAMNHHYQNQLTVIDNSTLDHLKFTYKNIHGIYTSRPFYYSLAIDSSVTSRYQRWTLERESESENQSNALKFIVDECNELVSVYFQLAHIIIDNDTNIPIETIKQQLQIKTNQMLEILSQLGSPSWNLYFLRLVNNVAQRSSCIKRKVGCILVTSNTHQVVSTGYNGTPKGIQNCRDGGCRRCYRNLGHSSETHNCLCIHAEENALLSIGFHRLLKYKYGGDPIVLYVNLCPCLGCAKKIIQAGIQKVFYIENYHDDETVCTLLESVGIICQQIKDLPSSNLLV
jgi:dCMP deaminase